MFENLYIKFHSIGGQITTHVGKGILSQKRATNTKSARIEDIIQR